MIIREPSNQLAACVSDLDQGVQLDLVLIGNVEDVIRALMVDQIDKLGVNPVPSEYDQSGEIVVSESVFEQTSDRLEMIDILIIIDAADGQNQDLESVVFVLSRHYLLIARTW